MQPDTERPSLARKLAIAFLLLAAVALIAVSGSAATFSEVDGWYAGAQKAPWSPPNWVFGPVWSVLYPIIALSGWLVWRAGFRAQRKNAATGLLALYAAQLVLNGLWTPVFFAGYPVAGPAAWWAAFVHSDADHHGHLVRARRGCVVKDRRISDGSLPCLAALRRVPQPRHSAAELRLLMASGPPRVNGFRLTDRSRHNETTKGGQS